MYLTTERNASLPHIEPCSFSVLESHVRVLAEKYTPRAVTRAFCESRKDVLLKLQCALEKRIEGLAEAMSKEASRPLGACTTEAKRSLQTVGKTIEALESLTSPVTHDLSDALQGGKSAAIGTSCTMGPLFAITPFNFPLNLAIHKIAPALALHIPFVCKLPSRNPLTYRILHEALLEAGVSGEEFAFIHTQSANVFPLLERVAFPLISFTGSKGVGLELRKIFWDRKVILELGGTATAVVCSDIFKAEGTFDAEIAASFVKSGFANSGQSCISLQHILVPQTRVSSVMNTLKSESTKIAQWRDPLDTRTVCSPLVDKKSFEKVNMLLQDARECGWEVWEAAPQEKNSNYIAPSLVSPATRTAANLSPAKLLKEEIFGPVLCIHPYDESLSPGALASLANEFDSNIHGSVYTHSRDMAEALFENLLVRTVLWNEVPSWRADAMPYGGHTSPHGAGNTWRSGLLGDEGPLQTLHEYTYLRYLVVP